MIITQPTVRTHAIPRPWIPQLTEPMPPEQQRLDAALLQRTAMLCAESYRKPAAFAAGKGFDYISERKPFGRGTGPFFWRLAALAMMPVNYMILALMIAAPVVVAIGLAALTQVLLQLLIGVTSHFWTGLLVDVPHWLWILLKAAALLGLFVGALTAVAPGLASGRAFGVVDAENNRVTVIFCGSKLWENLTINSLVWGHLPPLRHMGFYRAWDHLQPAVRSWLEKVAGEGTDKEIVLAGHSLGGALAQISALDLAADFRISHVISLGSACIGGKTVRRLFMERQVKGGGLLHERARHFTYTEDLMPRIPPVSIFSQAGRMLCLLGNGELLEGSEGSVIDGFKLLLAKIVSAFASLFAAIGTVFLDLATILRDAFVKWWSPPRIENLYFPPKPSAQPTSIPFSGVPPQSSLLQRLNVTPPGGWPQQPVSSLGSGLYPQPNLSRFPGQPPQPNFTPTEFYTPPKNKVTVGDIFRLVSTLSKYTSPFGKNMVIVLFVLHAILYMLFVLAVTCTLVPIVVLITMYFYYVVKIVRGLFFRHGASNYRDAFNSHWEAVSRPRPSLLSRPLLGQLGWGNLIQPYPFLSKGLPIQTS
jgi:pimeloyl-ACP methyl ester carboxylesterase